MQAVYSNELYHYGKIGMKWGTRRGPGIIANIKARDKAINSARRDLPSIQSDLKKGKEHFNKTGSSKAAEAHNDILKRAIKTENIALKKTSKEHATKIVSRTVSTIGGMSLAVYAASRG